MHKQLAEGQNDFFFLRDARSFDLRFLRELVGYVKSRNVDIVHSHEFFMNVYGTLAATLAGIPSVATVHGQLDYTVEKARRRIACRAVASRGCLVAVSNELAMRLSKEVGVPERRVLTVYNGICTDTFQTTHDLAGLRSELGIPKGAKIVGMVGNLYPVKGYQYFIKAMELVRRRFADAAFLVCGRGELQNELESLSAECGLQDNIKFLGFRKDIPALLQLMDVFVLSSLSEGLSLSILEAMAAGKPTVVTDVGGNREIVVDGETGFVVPSGNAGMLAEKVGFLLENRGLGERMGGNGRQRVNSLFSQERMVNDYEKLYKALVDKL